MYLSEKSVKEKKNMYTIKSRRIKIALLADIHSNHRALAACLELLKEYAINGIAFLGDYISDFPYPQRTIELLHDISSRYRTWFIRGNREDYMLSYRNGGEKWSYGSHHGSLLYTYENLREADFEFFSSMPISMTVSPDGCADFDISHGSRTNSRELIYPDTDTAYKLLSDSKCILCACAHTHKPFIYNHGGKCLINPGSVGVPTSGSTKAELAVIDFDGEAFIPTLLQAEYDIDAAVKDFYTSRLIENANVWSRTIIGNITTGRHINEECLRLVDKISSDRGVPFGTEEVWQEAAKLLGI